MSRSTPLRDPLAFAGRVETPVFESTCLAGNRAGVRPKREVPVYLPPGADDPGVELPVIFLLHAFTSTPQSLLETHPWKRGPVVEFDRAVVRGESPPAILVLPDGWTPLGGSQYVNSSHNGAFETHVASELVPWVDQNYPTLQGRRGLVGKSSGGFGALHLGMRHPNLFPAVASISGDCHFEFCYGQEILAALRGLVPFRMDAKEFLKAFEERPNLSGDAHAVLNVLAMSSCYSPNDSSDLGFDLPMDLDTGQRDEDVWKRWLQFDPVVASRAHAEGLRGLELLHLECGMRDEFHLQWSLRLLLRVLDELGVSYESEEHDGGHMGIGYRYGPALRRVAEVLGG